MMAGFESVADIIAEEFKTHATEEILGKLREIESRVDDMLSIIVDTSAYFATDSVQVRSTLEPKIKEKIRDLREGAVIRGEAAGRGRTT
jgi:hypothetical protein